MVTDRLFLQAPRLDSASARVLASGPEGIVLDRTVFYARGGGQPGDTGQLVWAYRTTITDTVNGDGEAILHVPDPANTLPEPGTEVKAVLDWPRRLGLMRMHTALHLLCGLLRGASVTGGQIGTERSRLDFDLPDPPPVMELEAALNGMVAANLPVSAEWVDESVLEDNPALVRTLSVQPPRRAGRIRLVRIGPAEAPFDLQPCGGTHVARTGEIGLMRVVKIESKGRQNRRIVIAPADAKAAA